MGHEKHSRPLVPYFGQINDDAIESNVNVTLFLGPCIMQTVVTFHFSLISDDTKALRKLVFMCSQSSSLNEKQVS